MQLKSLEIQGFKSFPDRTRLTFSKGITAVVGPNGSGKSNIADAMRWVLGEQSNKTLRSGKMEDVIFGGTQARRPQGFAYVALTIDNTDRRLPIQADEVTISRKLHRSGESEYRINHTAVRLKDVYELFMDTGLGRDGYSIIGQGRIAEIVSAKSSQRREIFEEAAGISKYRYRKGEAEKRLELAQENLLRLKDILQELEGRLAPLQEQSKKAKQFLEYAQEKKELEISLWNRTLEQSKARLREQEDAYLLTSTQYQELEERIEGIQSQMVEIYRQAQQRAVEMEEIRRQIKEMEEKSARERSKQAVQENDIGHNLKSIQQYEQTLQRSGESGEVLAARLGEKDRERQALQGQLDGLREQQLQESQGLLELQTQLNLLQEKREQSDSRLQVLLHQASEHRVNTAGSESLMAELQGRLAEFDQNQRIRQENLAQLQREASDCRELLEQVEEKIHSLQNARKGYELKQNTRREKLSRLQQSQNAYRQKAGELLQRAKLLSDLEKNLEGFANSVKFVMNNARSGRLRGIAGPVSELISVEKTYATAIEIALGAGMQNLVVEDEASAKAAIALLKNARAGRATFLPLTTMRGNVLREPGLDEMDGFEGVASELVTCEDRYRGVVNFLLGRIAVASDLDAAVAIAKAHRYRFRVVTLDGQVVNAGGSLTGGSVARSANILGRKNEITLLQQQAAQQEELAKGLEEELRRVTQEVASLDANLLSLDSELRTAQEDLIRYGAEEKRLNLSLQEAQDRLDRALQEQKNMEEKLQQERGKTQNAAQELARLEELRQEELERAQVLREQMNTLRDQLSQQGEAQNQRQMEILSLEKDLQAATLSWEQLKKEQEEGATLREQVQGMIDTLRQDNARLEAELQESRQRAEQLLRDVEQANGSIQQKSQQRQELEQSTTRLREGERELSQQKERLSKDLAKQEMAKQNLQKEFDDIIAKLWDEYELTRSAAQELAVEIPDPAAAQRRLGELRSRIKGLGNVNVDAIQEYQEVSERYTFLSDQLRDVEESRQELLELIRDLTSQMRELFTESFQQINQNFSAIFAELFGGGKGELKLTDPSDVLESGIDIFVQPPGKIIKNLAALSGGEQAFVAIAIYFAILKVRPAPFCLLDEIEAALDDVNVTRYAKYLHRLCDATQFITITHRRGTMEEADVLYGVTMQEEGVSKLLELKVTELESKLGMKIKT